jgi:DNA-directed RNA polymerase specialized sigma subunit
VRDVEVADAYMDRLLDGRALLDDIDEYVEAWHRDPSNLELHEYLGMSWEEYSLWVEQPSALRLLVAARERGLPVTELLEHTQDYALAARGGLSEREIRRMRAWLQETGRIPSS